jgi:hypothetical protein
MRYLGAFLFLLLQSGIVAAQCTKDTDCRGDRVCEDGRCVSQSGGASDPPPDRPKRRRSEGDDGIARICATQMGTCPMAVAIPRGSSCYCPSAWGPIGGVAR